MRFTQCGWSGLRSELRLCLAGLLIAGVTVLAGCETRPGKEVPMPERDIKVVMEDHVDSLMALPEVVGVAIGALDNGSPCLLILVVDTTEAVKREIPDTIEGYPVRVEVSGEIRPLGND